MNVINGKRGWMKMRDKYMKQLENLNNNMIEMGAMIEKSIENAISALVRQDVETAKKAIEYDAEIDEMEKNIKNMCMKILLSQQPVASDLRTVSSALKMVTDMERIGDQASDIAELIPHLGEGDTYDACSHIPAMAQVALEMVHGAINAFVEGDVQKAKEIINKDDIVDDYFDKVKNEVADLLREKTGSVDVILNFLMIAKYFERIGDHAENICEWVVYFETGKIVEL